MSRTAENKKGDLMRETVMVGGLVLLLSVAWAKPLAALLTEPTVSNPLADVTVTGSATTLLAAKSNRTGAVCTNNDAAVHVRLGDSTVTATKGVRLKAGNSYSTTSSGALSGISEGANVVVSCTEELSK